jgi:hypothetical protein
MQKKTKTIPVPTPNLCGEPCIIKRVLHPMYSIQIFVGVITLLQFLIFVGNLVQHLNTSIFDRVATIIMLILFFTFSIWNHIIEMQIREGK